MLRTLPILTLLACGGTSDDSSRFVEPCEGGGSAPTVQLGDDVTGGFEPWTDGQLVGLQGSATTVSLAADALVSGVDTTDQLNVTLRVQWDGADTDDYLAGFFAQCDTVTGESVLQLVAPLPEAYQADPSPLNGQDIPLTVTVTDQAGNVAQQELTITLSAR